VAPEVGGMSDRRVLLGRITGAHGLKGEVKIAAFTERPEDVAAYGPLTDADGKRLFQIIGFRSAPGGVVIARLKGTSSRDEAESLRGTDLFVARASLPPPQADDEYYHSDLIGAEAVSPAGEVIGEITAMYNFGAGDLLEVRFTGERQATLLPFEKAYVPKIDVAGKRVTIVKPDDEEPEDTP
jgi:16S rRNA processing protein RimM